MAGEVAGAEAAATAAEDRSAAPALVEVRAQLLLIGALRLVLAVAGLAAAIAVGERRGPAAALFAAGAVIVLVAILSNRRQRVVWQRLEQAEALESEPRLEPRRLIVARAAYPSTIGLTALIVLALVLEPALAALLAGILAGIGGTALGFAAQLSAWEQQRGARVLAEPGRNGRVFEAPR